MLTLYHKNYSIAISNFFNFLISHSPITLHSHAYLTCFNLSLGNYNFLVTKS